MQKKREIWNAGGHSYDVEPVPNGLYVVVLKTGDCPPRVVFVLKYINNSVNIDNQNRIHPFYMVYIGVDGEIVCDYLNPKKMWDNLRLFCKKKVSQ